MSDYTDSIAIGLSDTEYYSELLRFQAAAGNRRNLEPLDSSAFQNLFLPEDDLATFTQHMSAFLDTVVRLLIRRQGQVAAVSSSLEQLDDIVHTTLYIVFNRHPHDAEILSIRNHIRSILDIVRRIRISETNLNHSPSIESPIDKENEQVFWDLSRAIHTFSSDRLFYLIDKRQHTLNQAIRFLEKDQSVNEDDTFHSMFTLEESAALFGVFKDLQNIYLQSSSPSIGKIIGMKYESWIANGYLLAHDNEGEKQARLYMISELPLFEKIQWMMESIQIYFPLPRWARKIASYHLDSLSLMNLRQSDRFKRIIEGVITFEFLQPLAPRCDTFSVDLSDATILEAVTNAHRAFSESDVQNLALDADIFNFVDYLQTMLQNNARGGLYQEIIHSELYVHAEITMLHHVQRSQAQMFRYIAVSKLCCNMCTRYFRYHGEVFEIEPVGTLGSHGKHYPGWVLPACDSETEVHSNVIHHCLLRSVQRALAGFLRQYLSNTYHRRQRSDSTVGDYSGGRLYQGPETHEIVDALLRQESPDEATEEQARSWRRQSEPRDNLNLEFQ